MQASLLLIIVVDASVVEVESSVPLAGKIRCYVYGSLGVSNVLPFGVSTITASLPGKNVFLPFYHFHINAFEILQHPHLCKKESAFAFHLKALELIPRTIL